jgi:hypothetical protein
LAGVAAVVALVAYQAASQRPDLVATIKFAFSHANLPVLPHVEQVDGGAQLIDLDSSVDLVARITLTNKTKYSARNPYVRLELINLAGLTVPTDWSLVTTGVAGPTEIAWEGRDRSVHDKRDLPQVNFAGAKMLRNAPHYRIDLHVAAEGFAKTFPIRVELLPRNTWNQTVS